jgi:hypothetical protein
MLRVTNRGKRPGEVWIALVILLAVCSLTVRVATRYYSTDGLATARALHREWSPQSHRQRLTRDALTWMPPLADAVALETPTQYLVVGPPVCGGPYRVFETSLYNRPPPYPPFLAQVISA